MRRRRGLGGGILILILRDGVNTGNERGRRGGDIPLRKARNPSTNTGAWKTLTTQVSKQIHPNFLKKGQANSRLQGQKSLKPHQMPTPPKRAVHPAHKRVLAHPDVEVEQGAHPPWHEPGGVEVLQVDDEGGYEVDLERG